MHMATKATKHTNANNPSTNQTNTPMKQKLSLIAVAIGLALTVTTSQATMSFTGINNAQFNANGTTFQLNPIAGSSTTPQFDFTGVDAGLVGWISGGPWQVNMASLTTTTVGSITYQQAPLLGGGQLNIFDGVNTLTGNLSWGQIHTISDGQGGVADSLTLNLTGLTYAGLNGNLLALANGQTGNLNLTFQFSGTSPNLSSIYSGATEASIASYSGSISTVVPEPSTIVAGALLLLPFGISSFRILRKHRQNAA
jgi:hypothetical protein